MSKFSYKTFHSCGDPMYNFFATTKKTNDRYVIDGNDFNHIANVLRMQVGEQLLVSFNGKSDLCKIESLTSTTATVVVVAEDYQNCELPLSITLMQGIPKGDKMELIIQKAVELGVSDFIPVETSRCVVKIEPKKQASKVARWQAISESGAKQSKRNVIPQVKNILTFNQLIQTIDDYDLFILPYENEEGMQATKNALSLLKPNMKVALLIGPEGGFSEKEIEQAKEKGALIVSLGKRILRAETAAITALSMIMLYAECNF